MYPIAQETLKLFLEGKKNLVKLTVQTLDGTLHLTEADLWQSSLTIDRYCMSGSRIEIGAAIAAELTLKLSNSDGRFDNVTFEGAEIFVQIGAYDAIEHVYRYIPCGYFTVDEPPRKLSSITLRALDRMMQFDKPVSASGFPTPTTVSNLYDWCCAECNIISATLPQSLPMATYTIDTAPASIADESITYRQLIQWLAELNGVCAYIDWNGQLRMEWDNKTATVINENTRYSSDMYEDEISITGVLVEDLEGTEHLSGTDQYAFKISRNELIQHEADHLSEVLFARLGGFTYLPYSCKTKYLPHVWPLDRITYVDKKGIKHSTIVTHYTYKLNKSTSLAAKGETLTTNGYAAANPFTRRETAILNKMKQDYSRKLTAQEAATLNLNQVMSNAFGLYRTEAVQDDGSVKYYYHTNATLADSNTIYTMNSGGFAWTDDWNNGDPTWNYGIGSDGNAVLRTLTVYKLTADQIDATELKVEAANVTGKLTASQIDTTKLKVNAANITGTLTVKSGNNVLLQAGNGAVQIGGWSVDNNSFFNGTNFGSSSAFLCSTGSNSSLTVAGITRNGWVIKAGPKFGVSIDGAMYASDVHISGGSIRIPLDLEGGGANGITIGAGGIYIEQDDTTGGGTWIDQDRILLTSGSINGDTFYTGALWTMNGVMIKNYSVSSSGNAAYIKYNTYASDDSGLKLMAERVTIASGYVLGNKQTNRMVIDTNGGHLYGTWVGTSSGAITSDATLKHDIEDLPEKYGELFDALRPVRYQYNDGTSDRRHTGFIAQDVKSAMDSAGVDSKEFAGYVVTNGGIHMLRYEEFIALNTFEIQKLKKQVQKILNGGY